MSAPEIANGADSTKSSDGSGSPVAVGNDSGSSSKISSTDVADKPHKSVKLNVAEVGADPDASSKKNGGPEPKPGDGRGKKANFQSTRSYPPPFYCYNKQQNVNNYGAYHPQQQRSYQFIDRYQQNQQGYQHNYQQQRQQQPFYGHEQHRGGGRGAGRRHYSSTEHHFQDGRRKSRSINGSNDDIAVKPEPKAKSHQRDRSSHSESVYHHQNTNDELELEEPFSDSDDGREISDKAKATKKKRTGLALPLPRRRIRTLSGMVPNIGYSPVFGGPTMCLNCFDFFDLPNQTEQYVDHLLTKHRIVIGDIKLIVDLKRYIEHWRHRFGSEPIEKIFPEIVPDENDEYYGKLDKYFLMSEKLLEDRQVREKLAMRRLEEVLSCQQREREDTLFSRQCLFCRYHATGNRSKLIHHLYMIHHLNLGSPDNLVFVSEYLDVLEDKLQNRICIYCENQFADASELNEHIRKKYHLEVNPENNYYDKFYVINYLELGKKWIEVLAEDFEDTMPTFVDSEEEEEEESWNEWQDDNLDDEQTVLLCLFCDETVQKFDLLLAHLKEKHSFDLKREVAAEDMNFYDRVKYINYIRACCHKCTCFACGKDDLHSWPALRKHLSEESHPGHVSKIPDRKLWDKEDYLIPTFENDSLLCFLDELDDEQTLRDKASLPYDPAILDNGPVINGGGEADKSGSMVVAEDAVDLSYTILTDKELREQLQ